VANLDLPVTMTTASLRVRNPLALPVTRLSPPVLLMARLVILALFLRGYAIAAMPARRVPFFAWCETIGSAHDWKLALVSLFVTGAFLVFFNRLPRIGCLLAGSALIFGTLINSANYANSRLFPGCLLVLTALQDGGAPARLALRGQIFVLYLGASLSKLFEPDWWTGQYFEFWLREKLNIAWYARLADALPPMALSTFMGVTTIIMEAVICVSLLRRSWWPMAFVTAILFHVGGFLICGLDFGVFLYVSLLSFLVFAPDDLFPRLAGLRIAPGWRSVASRPWTWMLLLFVLISAGQVWPLGQRILAFAYALFMVRVVLVYVRQARVSQGSE